MTRWKHLELESPAGYRAAQPSWPSKIAVGSHHRPTKKKLTWHWKITIFITGNTSSNAWLFIVMFDFQKCVFKKKTYLHPWPLVLGYFCCSGISSRGGLGQPCFVMNLGIMSESKSHHRLKGENISENTSVDFITISFPNSHVELPPWKSIVRQKISKLLGGLDV